MRALANLLRRLADRAAAGATPGLVETDLPIFPSRIATCVSTEHLLRDSIDVGQPAFGIEVQAVRPAERGEVVSIEVHSDYGDTRAAEVLFQLMHSVHELLVRRREHVAIGHHSPDLREVLGTVPSQADSNELAVRDHGSSMGLGAPVIVKGLGGDRNDFCRRAREAA